MPHSGRTALANLQWVCAQDIMPVNADRGRGVG